MKGEMAMIGAGALAVAGASFYYATTAVRSQWLGPTHWRGPNDQSAVALTFDDGPSGDTEMILDVLAQYRVPATFFMVGQQVESFPGLAQQVSVAGHEVGNHSYSHLSYLLQSPAKTFDQLKRAQDVIATATGTKPQFVRPPFGVRTPAYFKAARSLELATVQWDVAGFDWKKINANQIAANVLSRVRAGSIVLLHDGDSTGKRDRSQTVAALPLIIQGLQERRLRIDSLTQILPRTASGHSTRRHSNEASEYRS